MGCPVFSHKKHSNGVGILLEIFLCLAIHLLFFQSQMMLFSGLFIACCSISSGSPGDIYFSRFDQCPLLHRVLLDQALWIKYSLPEKVGHWWQYQYSVRRQLSNDLCTEVCSSFQERFQNLIFVLLQPSFCSTTAWHDVIQFPCSYLKPCRPF